MWGKFGLPKSLSHVEKHMVGHLQHHLSNKINKFITRDVEDFFPYELKSSKFYLHLNLAQRKELDNSIVQFGYVFLVVSNTFKLTCDFHFNCSFPSIRAGVN